jgi:methyl-accepting chemotaxis protein
MAEFLRKVKLTQAMGLMAMSGFVVASLFAAIGIRNDIADRHMMAETGALVVSSVGVGKAIQEIEDTSDVEIRDTVSAAEQAINAAIILHAALLLGLSVACGAAATVFIRTAARELRAISDRVERLSKGDLESPIPRPRIPELARIAAALGTFRSNEIDRIAEEERVEELQQKSSVGITRVVDAVSAGDFSARLRLRDLKGASLMLAEGINSILCNVEDVVTAQKERDEQAHRAVIRTREEQAAIHSAAADEIAEIVAACSRGDFSRRIPTEGKDGVFHQLSLGVNGIANAAESGLRQIQSSLSAIASGDLSRRMDGEFHGLYAEIQHSLDETLENLSRIMAEIEDQSGLVAQAADEIRKATDDLARRTEHQTETVRRSADATEQLARTVQGNADSMDTGRDLTRQLGVHADEGARISNEAIHAIEGIENASGEMAKIVNVIEEIAFQTSLLALNASVEAARAGEAGRGFSVVASEVRSLANRCSEASKQIGDLIEGNIREVKTSSAKVRESGLALKRIEEATAEVISLVENVSASSQLQAGGIRELGTGMADIDQITQRNAELVQRTADLMEGLVESGKSLFQLVQMFRPGDDEHRTGGRRPDVAAE